MILQEILPVCNCRYVWLMQLHGTYDEGCFQIIDYASSPFRVKVKEALHINWLKPDLKKQKEHVSITISV